MVNRWDEWLTEDGLLRVRGWARDGLTNDQIAKNMRVSRSTLMTWRRKFPELDKAAKKGKDVADREVENALFKSACGYTVTITKPVKLKRILYDEETGRKVREYEEVVEVEEQLHFPAQVTAQIFWLKNRKPAQWRDKTDVQQLPTNGVLESLLAMEKGAKS